MLNSRRLWVVTGLGVALLFGSIRSSLAADRQFLRGHVPEAVSHLQPTGHYPGTNHLNLAIGLPLRNEAALDELLQQIYDPASPNFRHYLTSEQLAKRFGPTEQDYQAVIDFAKANGLTVTGTHPNRVILDVSGTVADMERIFHVTMHTYRHPTENRTFFAPDAEPSIDLAIPILHISGLDDFIKPRPMSLKMVPLKNSPPATTNGSSPSGNYIGKDFRVAYAPGVSLNGSGQVVGLLELDGYYTSDITKYEHQAGLTNVPLQNVLIDSFNGTPGGNNGEVALDIEMAISMAPGLSNVVVYELQNGSNIVDMLDRMVTDNLAKQISSSWLIGDNPSFDVEYKLMAGQGQSFFQASGDDGAYYSGIGQWADDTNITLVGGTSLTMISNGVAWSSESAWNWYITNPPYTNSTGGGISLNNIPIPSWQQGINMTTNKGSTTLRNVPDVALTADNILLVANNGGNYSAGGTSAAAPLWAGFTALVNQQAITLGGTNVGFLNPAIYTIGNGPNYTADFHDITTGNNTNTTVGNKYFAVPGYDLCTGWGTPNGMNLINALATPNLLGIFPGTGFTSSGPVGGPFNVTSQNFSLTNFSGTSLNWSLIGIPPWLGVSSAGGTLPASGSTTVTVNLNSTASNLLAGIYTTNLVFTNMTGGVAQSRQFTLQVGQSLVQNGGFETGDFSFWTLNGDGYNYNYVDDGSTVTAITPHSGSYFAALGEVGFLAYLSQNIPTFAGRPYLLSLWLDSPNVNPTIPNDFLVQWNGNTLFNSTNMGAFAWSNLQFIVTATSSSTILNIGAQDDNYYLGLDDITVTPIPATLFQPVTQTNGAITFSWNAMIGLVYQVQYKTNLLQANWVNLGNAITATNSTLTATNFISSDPQRFYRLLLLP